LAGYLGLHGLYAADKLLAPSRLFVQLTIGHSDLLDIHRGGVELAMSRFVNAPILVVFHVLLLILLDLLKWLVARSVRCALSILGISSAFLNPL
jgi:hypothetical protein